MTHSQDQSLEVDTVPLLLDEEDVRYAAALAIARQGRPVIPQALAWADDPRPRMREMACYILGQVGDRDGTGLITHHYPGGLPVLVRLLEQDSEATVRASAAAALGHIASPSTVSALSHAASDVSEVVRWDVAVALAKFYSENWPEDDTASKDEACATLLRLMDDVDEDVRNWATFGMHQGGHDTAETRARLWQALDDSCWEVRGEAAEALARFGDRSLIPRLETLLRDDEERPCHYFIAAEELGDPALLPAVEAAAARWESDDDVEGSGRSAVVSALESLWSKANP